MIASPQAGPRLTGEQAAALAVRGSSVALGAGAGCGKTTVLTERFVRALEGPDASPLDRVVALTFTRKAARELKGRIRRECRRRLASGHDPERWRAILRGLEMARIGTIHSFCGEILRAHAVEADIDPGFAVLDDPIGQALRARALDASIREGLAARDPDLIDLAVEFGLRMVRQTLDDLLDARAVGDLRAWVDREPAELVALWAEAWDARVRPALLRKFADGAAPCLEVLAAHEYDHDKVRARSADFRAAFDRFAGADDADAALQEIRGLAKVAGLTEKHWPSAECYGAIKDHFESIRGAVDKLRPLLVVDEHASMVAARQGLQFARLAEAARATFERAKRDRGAVDNDDLLILTLGLLSSKPETVAKGLAESIDLILVDEFQDTDPTQSAILEALAGPDLLGGRLFLVGDFKQSIYRFRGARPELFRAYRDRFPEAGRLDLTENFRSVPAILDFVNALFADTFPEKGQALVAGGSPDRVEAEPATYFLWGEPGPQSSDPKAKPDAEDKRRGEAARLARHLDARLRRGWPIRDPADGSMRDATPGDVAFLFRSLSDAPVYERALVDQGLDFHVVGGSSFFLQQEVLDLINVLAAVEDPLDSIALAGTLRSPFFSISDEALHWVATERVGSPHEGLRRAEGPWLDRLPEADRPRVARARALLAAWRGVKDNIPFAALVDRILDESGYEAALLGEPLGDRKRANARKLARMARQFDEQGGFTLADFVARLRDDLKGATKETQAATTDEQGRVIRLMSIHQAKGLEFPIVVIPDLDRKRPGQLKRVAFSAELGPLVNPVIDPAEGDDGETLESGGSLGWRVHKALEDEADEAEGLRLFYVATTRARDALILSAATDPAARPTSPALKLLDARFDRATGLLRALLPEGWHAPRVEVISSAATAGAPDSATRTLRPRPRLLETARTIEEGLARPAPEPETRRRPPRYVALDPAAGLPSTAARLDRLVRAILADPDGLDPASLDRVADRAARLQDFVAPRDLRRRAVERVLEALPLIREVARGGELVRAVEWTETVVYQDEPIVFRGRADFLVPDAGDGPKALIVGDFAAVGPAERLRLLLSGRLGDRMVPGAIRQGWWIRLGPGGGTRRIDPIDEPAIQRAVRELLARPGH